MEALERAGTEEGRRVLEGIAKDLPDSWAAAQAKAVLERLGKQK